jgi:flavin-binding protein dodecin
VLGECAIKALQPASARPLELLTGMSRTSFTTTRTLIKKFDPHETPLVTRDCTIYRVQIQNNLRRTAMAQKIIDVVGTSKESFAKAAENAVAQAAKTVRGMRWARVSELEVEIDGKKIAQYRATTKIYFDIEK